MSKKKNKWTPKILAKGGRVVPLAGGGKGTRDGFTIVRKNVNGGEFRSNKRQPGLTSLHSQLNGESQA